MLFIIAFTLHYFCIHTHTQTYTHIDTEKRQADAHTEIDTDKKTHRHTVPPPKVCTFYPVTPFLTKNRTVKASIVFV